MPQSLQIPRLMAVMILFYSLLMKYGASEYLISWRPRVSSTLFFFPCPLHKDSPFSKIRLSLGQFVRVVFLGYYDS